jgi:hypothetical protein
MVRRSRTWKADVDAIRRILMAEWDPIACGVPEDEYDSYIPGIYRLMQGRAGVEGLAAHLGKLETLSMGLPAHADRNRPCRQAAARPHGINPNKRRHLVGRLL